MKQPTLDPNALSGCELTAFHHAIGEGFSDDGPFVEVAKALLGDGRVDPNIQVQEHKLTPLNFAVEHGICRGMVRTILADPRVDVNLADVEGSTPLLAEIFFECFDLVEGFLEEPLVDIYASAPHHSQYDSPEGTAFEMLLFTGVRLCDNDDWLGFNRCVTMCMERESRRVKENREKVACVVSNSPLLRDPFKLHGAPFLSDELRQKIVSPKAIEYVKKICEGKALQSELLLDVMKDVKKFVDQWGNPDAFDFGDLAN